MSEIVHIERIGKGDLSIKVGKQAELKCDKERAEFICRILAHHLGFAVIEEHRLKGFCDVKSVQEEK